MTLDKQKLELTWIGKDKRPRLEPRIFVEDKSLSYQESMMTKGSEKEQESGIFNDNLLIQSDNLLALKALEQQYAGQVKCVFIDPPYNTGSAFTHYDDGLEHSMWLTLMRDRLELLRSLLSEEGSLWITIDDTEAHYLKVLCDEVFGRANFVSNIVWQKKYSKQNDSKWFSTSHDHIFVYAKNKNRWFPNKLDRSPDELKGYKNPDNDPRGPWQSVVYTCAKTKSERPNLYYPITHPKTGEEVYPSESRVWAYDKKRHEQHIVDGLLWWGENNDKDKPRLKSFLSKVGNGIVPDTLWLRDGAGDNQDAKREARAFFPLGTFDTPKPEKLIQKILQISTGEGDLVLDSFAGSGTTGAVAHKMRRRWIMVELGEHCETHIVPRLKKVIDGEDQGGITKAVNWQGGGGFRYLRLAPSLLKKDDWGNWIINKEYNPEMLAEAVCKHMGFTYAPSQTQFWNHGYSTETDHIYVTTGSLAYDQLKRISDEVGSDRTLLICCKAFMAEGAELPNLTLKKIPKAILNKCEWDHDDYSFTLNILPEEQVDDLEDDEIEG
ncbi:site-specific DNA-methyltransferase [Atlantibacter hermannii]|uniref:site-specific DNA-methyltransferase n=1 Tax=Atlantibacter hermannii TaxID=565 RepID=UPI0028A86E8C|nr:site-specific DNA-methyltransferase [Atlantibacter hermannii]